MSSFLVVNNLKKSYGNTQAVRGISFEVFKGEVFSLLGPNGAGKTTLISMLSCLLEPTDGDATIGSHSVRKEKMAVKRLIGVVPQELALYGSLSPLQNLNFWGKMYGMGGTELTERIDELLELVGLADRARDRVDSFSGGMKRRLNIAVGLIHKPQLLFMDEPTVGIDPQSRRNILDMVKSLREQGITVLYTTHYMEEAEELSDRVAIIDHGKLIAIGTQQELMQMVDDKETLTLHFTEEAESSLVERLSTLPDVHHVAANNSHIALTVGEAPQKLPEIMQLLSENGNRVRSIDITAPHLEAVFLHLTGRALRD